MLLLLISAILEASCSSSTSGKSLLGYFILFFIPKNSLFVVKTNHILQTIYHNLDSDAWKKKKKKKHQSIVYTCLAVKRRRTWLVPFFSALWTRGVGHHGQEASPPNGNTDTHTATAKGHIQFRKWNVVITLISSKYLERMIVDGDAMGRKDLQ